MQILYRYIFQRGLVASILVVTTCCVIASLINLFDILDDVVKQNMTPSFLYRYLLINLAPRTLELLSIVMILAGMFTMGEFNRRLELVSMRAAGLSDFQLLQPLVILAGILFSIMFALQMYYIPELQERGDELKTLLKAGRSIGALEKPFYVQKDRVGMQVAAYQPEKKMLTRVRVMIFEGRHVAELYEADTIVFAGGWTILRGTYRRLDPATGQVLKYDLFERRAWPQDLPPPQDLIAEAAHRRQRVQWMTLAHLVDERSFPARQEIHKRIATSLATAIGMLVGAWYGMRMHRFNAARAILLAMIIGFAHRLVLDGFLAVGVSTGASWACHASNLFLIAMAAFAPLLGFLTAS